MTEFDVFISHATEDKDDIARPLADLLTKNGYRVWFDEVSINLGDSLEDSIKKGISNSRYAVVILSPIFFQKGWTKRELKLLRILQHHSGVKRIIPVWHNLSHAQLIEIDPELADLVSGDSSEGLEKLYLKICKAIGEPELLLSKNPYYQVGKIRADIFLDLLGGGDEEFTSNDVRIDYEHVFSDLPPIINESREEVLHKIREYNEANGREFFNGPTIRLHAVNLGIDQDPGGEEKKHPILLFRPTSWFDYVLTNQRLDVPISGLGLTLREAYADESRLVNSRRIDWIPFSNILTCTVVLISRDNYVRITRRSERVDNSSGVYAASVAENVHRWKDEIWDLSSPWYSQPSRRDSKNVDYSYKPSGIVSPFLTALRGIREEIGDDVAESVSPDDIKLISIAWNLSAYQPHMIFKVRSNLPRLELEQIERGSTAPDDWEATGYWLPFELNAPLVTHLSSSKWAEISKGAILRALVHEYGFKKAHNSLS